MKEKQISKSNVFLDHFAGSYYLDNKSKTEEKQNFYAEAVLHYDLDPFAGDFYHSHNNFSYVTMKLFEMTKSR